MLFVNYSTIPPTTGHIAVFFDINLNTTQSTWLCPEMHSFKYGNEAWIRCYSVTT